jgi:menaquinone-specific isochorismate synthase
MSGPRYKTEINIEPIMEDIIRLVSLADENRLSLPFVIERPIPEIDIAAWLAEQPAEQKFYWCGRDGRIEIGGIGIAFSLKSDVIQSSAHKADSILKILSDNNLIFLGGRRFSTSRNEETADPIWQNLAEDISFIPEKFIFRQEDDHLFRYCLPVTPDSDYKKIVSRVEKLLNTDTLSTTDRPNEKVDIPLQVKHYPHRDGWERNVLEVLSAISSGQVEKTVLARRSDFCFDDVIDGLSLFLFLRRHNPGCYAMLYQPSPGIAFISFSPERLFYRSRSMLQIDALSSTVIRGETEPEDHLLEKYLRHSDKERREHQYVIDDIAARVGPLFCDRVQVSDTSVMKLERLQHLRTTIGGELNNGISDSQVLDQLHPTAAVGGVPRRESLGLINKLEPFERGWYGAPFGYMSGRETEFAVAIRSALVRGRTVSVFAGAGIVAGSEPEAEWRELDNKNILNPLLAGAVVR